MRLGCCVVLWFGAFVMLCCCVGVLLCYDPFVRFNCFLFVCFRDVVLLCGVVLCVVTCSLRMLCGCLFLRVCKRVRLRAFDCMC